MREILYEDEAGNKLIRDHDQRIAGINREGRIVNAKGLNKLLHKAGIKTGKKTWRSKTRGTYELDLGEPKGFYFGTKEKKQSGFGQIDFDFGLKL